MYEMRILPLFLCCFFFFGLINAQTEELANEAPSSGGRGYNYLVELDDARLDLGLRVVNVFALDDRAPLSSNPHFQAMWNLIKLGSELESLLQGLDEPLNDIDLSREFGQNGYNKTLFMLFLQYGFGESSDLALQRHFFELGLSSGYFKEGQGGLHAHLDYRINVAKTGYGAGVNSISKFIDYEVFLGARIGFDWSSSRSEGETGFFTHLKDEIKRVANENEFSAAQLIRLEQLAEDSKILLPGDVGGRAFHAGPIAGARLSSKLFGQSYLFVEGIGFFDLMDLSTKQNGKENTRSQHHVAVSVGFLVGIGGEGRGIVNASGGGVSFF